ncbi:hypothetical protein [Arthrobacter silvisoli]|uniref:hypothetical protein n=1 Tax=Arthrobacter silvisoli TaxID=2291022 RepID=UPI000E2154D7|nr:hypothetical protein [Arthrobacter silvisoli]
MSEHRPDGSAAGINRLLAESGLEDAADIRAGLLELRSLADIPPEPSAQLRALMVPATPAAGDAGGTAPVDELAARRRKRRLAVTAVAVAASLAVGATAAAASGGGIPAVLSHLGNAVGTAVSRVLPRPAAPPAAPPALHRSPRPNDPTDAPAATPVPSVNATPGAGNLAPVPHRSGASPEGSIPGLPGNRTVKLPVPVPTVPLPLPAPRLTGGPANPDRT